ncbi:MAG TPA: sulfotransferase [Rhodanobacter sp.]|jgi:tetratricopeptide (TPR) repeat protein|nr:sulfotransferase [Rhodanobacter sp.]
MTTEPSTSIVEALQAARPADAERLCRAQLADNPNDEQGLQLLAMSLHFQHRLPEAAAAYSRLTELNPSCSAYWCNYGTALLESGATSEAERAYAAAIGLDPGNLMPKVQMGLLLLERKNFLAARETLLDAFEIDKSAPLTRIHAAHACCLCQDFHGAADLLKPWRTWLPLDSELLQLELAKLLQLMGDTPSSAVLLEDLITRRPSHLEARLLLAKVYERSNELARSEVMAQALLADPMVSTDEARSDVRHLIATLALRNGDITYARSMLEQCGPRHASDYAHYFELADTYDKLGEPGQAMQALRIAHEWQVQELRIASPEFFLPDSLALPAVLPHVTPETYRRWPTTMAPDSGDSPVFIVGFPRSGTTLLEQMLDAHPDLQSMDENPFFNRLADKLKSHDAAIMDKLELLQQRDCDELRKLYLIMVSEKIPRRWQAQLVDKNPLNMLWLPLIHRLFPRAKFILAVRHPCDVILSCYMQNFRSSILGAACVNLQRLAAAYVGAMDYWLRNVAIFQPDVLVSHHEDLVTDFPGHTARIAQFLRLDDATPMLRFNQHARDKGYIATPSYDQVIEPVNRKGMNRWTRYQQEFELVLPTIEPMLRYWGYSARHES